MLTRPSNLVGRMISKRIVEATTLKGGEGGHHEHLRLLLCLAAMVAMGGDNRGCGWWQQVPVVGTIVPMVAGNIGDLAIMGSVLVWDLGGLETRLGLA